MDQFKSDLSAEEYRLILACIDIQESLSALIFFKNIPDQISEVENRQYRCFHDMMVISYWRPFSDSNGLPKLSFKKLGLKLNQAENSLHKRIKVYRNKVVAHTDVDKLRLAVKAQKFDALEDIELKFPHIYKDKSFEFLDDRRELEKWLRKLAVAITDQLIDLFQSLPPDKKFKIDYLEN